MYRIFGTFYTINNTWRLKTISCRSTRLLFLPLMYFTSCGFCFFSFFLFSTFSTSIFLFCYILATFSSFWILFSSSLSFFCLLQSALFLVIYQTLSRKAYVQLIVFIFVWSFVFLTKQVQHLFGQKNKTSATDLSRIVILEWAELANLFPWGNRFAMTSLRKGLIFSVDISCTDIYSFSRKDSTVRNLLNSWQKILILTFCLSNFPSPVYFFFVRPTAAYENNK